MSKKSTKITIPTVLNVLVTDLADEFGITVVDMYIVLLRIGLKVINSGSPKKEHDFGWSKPILANYLKIFKINENQQLIGDSRKLPIDIIKLVEDYVDALNTTKIEVYNTLINIALTTRINPFKQMEDIQTTDVSPKNTQSNSSKKIELAKINEEEKPIYRVSYLNENDSEIWGMDLGVETDEEAMAAMDDFEDAADIIDDLVNIKSDEVDSNGITSFVYKDVTVTLSNIITIIQEGQEPILLKSSSFDKLFNQLIYWFIKNHKST